MINAILIKDSTGKENQAREREASSCRMEESKGLPCQVPTTNVSKWFKFRVNVDQVRFHGLYRCLCKDFLI